MTKFDTRLACSTTTAVADRLALTALVRHQSQSEIATAALDEHLPSAEELADEIRKGAEL